MYFGITTLIYVIIICNPLYPLLVCMHFNFINLDAFVECLVLKKQTTADISIEVFFKLQFI